MNDNGRRMLTRALRLNCGLRTPTTWLGLYSIDTTGDDERRRLPRPRRAHDGEREVTR